MINRIINALARALLVAIMVALPSLALPNISSDGAQIAIFTAILAALFIFAEYSSQSPSIIEFRDARPFNRMRYFMAVLIVLLLTALSYTQVATARIPDNVAVIAQFFGERMDLSISPVRLVVIAMPDETPLALLFNLRDGAALAYAISLVGVAAFFILVRVYDWPARNGAFNVWVNLPLFDPTAGGDVVLRLRRDGYIHLVVGALLPYAMPALAAMTLTWFDATTLLEGQSYVWSVAAWSFIPASMMMRGIAMCRIAELIAAKRQRTYARAASETS